MPGFFLVIGSLIGAAILCGMVMSLLRGRSSESSWSRTTGQVKSFKIVHGSPACTYQYQVNGMVLEGKKIQPGAGPNLPDTQIPKSVYLEEDGRLKFLPGQAVEVFYNPKNPSDSALVVGIPRGIGIGIAIALLIFGILGFCVGDTAWASAHEELLIPLLFFFGGLLVFIWGISRSLRFLQSRTFPSTSGKVLKATAIYQSGSDDGGGGYVPEIEVRYAVNGVEYCTTELSSSPMQTLHSEEFAEGLCRRLLAAPEVTVYYDPQAPWLAFLHNGHLFTAFLAPAMGAVFMIVGICVFISQRRD